MRNRRWKECGYSGPVCITVLHSPYASKPRREPSSSRIPFFKYGNIEDGRYLGVMESMIEADATWMRIRREGQILASIYDPETFKRHPDGLIA
jgi:hypothetical protein